MPEFAGPKTGEAEGISPVFSDRPVLDRHKNEVIIARMISASLDMRPGFVSPWSLWRIILARLQFGSCNVHIQLSRTERGLNAQNPVTHKASKGSLRSNRRSFAALRMTAFAQGAFCQPAPTCPHLHRFGVPNALILPLEPARRHD